VASAGITVLVQDGYDVAAETYLLGRTIGICTRTDDVLVTTLEQDTTAKQEEKTYHYAFHNCWFVVIIF
jgi:hypothetical protein